MSTTKRRGKYYYEFRLGGKISVALLSQIRAFDSLRLDNGRKHARIGIVDKDVFDAMKQKIHQLVD